MSLARTILVVIEILVIGWLADGGDLGGCDTGYCWWVECVRVVLRHAARRIDCGWCWCIGCARFVLLHLPHVLELIWLLLQGL